MRNKKVLVIGLTTLFFAIGVGAFLYLKSQEKQTENKLKIVQSSVVKQSQVSGSTTQSSEEETQTSTTFGTIHDNIDKIVSIVKRLNDFDIGYRSDFDKIVEELATYGVKVDENLPTPYGLYEYSDGIVFIADVQSHVVEQKQDGNYSIRLVTRTIAAESVSQTNKKTIIRNLRRHIESKRYIGDDRIAEYKLTVSAEGKTGILTLESGQWW